MRTEFTRAHLMAGLYFGLLALGGVGAAGWTLSIPGDERGVLWVGLSASRLALLAVIVGLTILATVCALRALRQPAWAEKITTWLDHPKARGYIFIAAGGLALIGWLAAFMPAYWFDAYKFFFSRLQPTLVWSGFSGALLLAFASLPGLPHRWKDFLAALRSQKNLLRGMAIALGIFALVWLIAAITGLGIVSEPYFWDEASIPLLGVQLILSVVATVAVSRLVIERIPLKQAKWTNLLVFASVWVFAFALWYFTPLRHSFFAPGPHPPNYVFYPYSDAQFYDLAAQYVLIGQGIFNGIPFDKPLYAFFIAIGRAITGQNYDPLITFQLAVLALMPAVLYLLGSRMMNQSAGLLIAMLAVFHQQNAIAATPYIKVSHSKLLMTEYPTALLLVVFALFAFLWLKNNPPNLRYAVLAGGFLGLAMLIRPNALMVAPFVILLVGFFRGNWRRWMVSIAVMVSVLFLTMAPFLIDIPRGHTEPYIVIKIRTILDTRILTDSPIGALPGENEIAAAGGAWFKPVQPEQNSDSLLELVSRFDYFPRHFFHNLLMVAMLPPNTWALEDLPNTLQAMYWKDVRQWQGELPAGAHFLLPFNLVILALGIGAAWQRWRAAGLVPLAMMPGYFVANSLARNSGWRYLVPIDWVVLVYFGIGLLVLLGWLGMLAGFNKPKQGSNGYEIAQQPVVPARKQPWFVAAGFVVLFFGAGLLLPLSEDLLPDRFSTQSPRDLFEQAQQAGISLDREAIRNFLNSPNHYVNHGLGLYPRFYYANTGEPQKNLPLVDRPYPRFTLSIVASDTFFAVILPMNHPMPSFPHGEEVIVLGCIDSQKPFIDAYAVAVLSDPPVVYWREPAAELVCPLPKPPSAP
ncbi:MAG: glycosyltransferase family 39 protein [Bellilinea sp.]|jgi:hypothetical protein